jgi:hypothetical protein
MATNPLRNVCVAMLKKASLEDLNDMDKEIMREMSLAKDIATLSQLAGEKQIIDDEIDSRF